MATSTAYPHALLPPGRSYPNWVSPDESLLIYLGWGSRNYDLDPISVHSNPGWSYYFLLRGRAFLEGPSLDSPIEAGAGLLAAPPVPFGFRSAGRGACQVLVWIWAEPPGLPELQRPAPLRGRFSRDALARLSAWHDLSRREAALADSLSPSVLRGLRAQIDAEFARCLRQQTEDRDALLLRVARDWIAGNLHSKRPADELADYLKLSPMGLHRLFRRNGEPPPGACFQHAKLERCRQMLVHEKRPVKWVALEMGYKHPSDFSRAFRAHFGIPPSDAYRSGPDVRSDPYAHSTNALPARSGRS